MYGVSNDAADKLLMETLPKTNGIKPRFVHSGMKHELEAAARHGHPHPGAREGHRSLLSRRGARREPQRPSRHLATRSRRAAARRRPTRPMPQPANISATDFRVLQSRMLSNGLAFAAKESSIQNNLSVVLLIEWKKRRLLFVGDAEWEGEFKEGKHNGSWNVMWEKHRNDAPEGAGRLPEDRPPRQHQRHAAARGGAAEVEEGADGRHLRGPGHDPAGAEGRAPSRPPRRSSRPNASSTTRFRNASCWSTWRAA